MRLLRSALLAGLALVLAACGDDDPAKPTGPVTLRFVTNVFPPMADNRDTVKGFVVVDGRDTVQLPYGSLDSIPRGQHTFQYKLTHDYLPGSFTMTVDPSGNVATIPILQAGTCRVFEIDEQYCIGQENGRLVPRNALFHSPYNRIYCPASDFGEFCARWPDARNTGLTWPTDDSSAVFNEYVTHAKLLVAATTDPGMPVAADANRKIAMALELPGDYSPRRRLRAVSGDSTRYLGVTWSDARHIPIYNFRQGQLADTDRRLALFGLQVRSTYFLPTNMKDVLFVRYDVTNISDSADYRRVHPDAPVAGFTLRDIWLAPTIDPDIGGTRFISGGSGPTEASDDHATVLADEGILVAWDRTFSVAAWGTGWRNRPGLVGMKVIATDIPGTPKAFIASAEDELTWRTTDLETETHAILAAGRSAPLAGCTDRMGILFDCVGENAMDIRMGWSVGPIASLAPGETRSLTIAIMLAEPKAGAFTSGTAVAPQNADLSNTRAIHGIAEALRALATQAASVTVTPAP